MGLGACQTKKTDQSASTDSVARASETTTGSTAEPLAGHAAELGLTLDSDWRGISLGDDFASVKTKEKGELFENDAQHLGYTVEFPSLETADMLYYQTGQKVSSIVADLYLNKKESVEAYQKDLTTYFSARYGQAKTAAESTIWSGPNGQLVSLKNVSKGKDFGLKIKIQLESGVTTASAK